MNKYINEYIDDMWKDESIDRMIYVWNEVKDRLIFRRKVEFIG